MRNKHDLCGKVFGRLVVLSYVGKRYWDCRCACGTRRKVHGSNLKSGATRSCGCLARELTSKVNSTHGYTAGYRPKSEYSTWTAMIARCHRETWINYADYGGRGVTVCDRWRFGEDQATGFECFIADMGAKPSKSHTLERIDGAREYCPDNCRWATRKEQARNRRSNRVVPYKGQHLLLSDALTASGISESGFYARVKNGWTEQEALETPPFQKPTRLRP